MLKIEENNQMLINRKLLILIAIAFFSSCASQKPNIRFDGIYVKEGNSKKEFLIFYKFYENDSFQSSGIPKGFSITPDLLNFYRDCYFWGTWFRKGDSLFLDENILHRNKVVYNRKDTALFINNNKLKLVISSDSNANFVPEIYELKFRRFKNKFNSKEYRSYSSKRF